MTKTQTFQVVSRTTQKSFPRSLAFLNSTIKDIIYSGLIILGIFVFTGAVKAQSAEVAVPILSTPTQAQQTGTPMPLITGSASGATEVLVHIDSVLNGTAKVIGGRFSYTPFLPLSSGNHTIQLQARDVLGNTSPRSIVTLVHIIPNPSPTLLVPKADTRLGQDRVYVGGVSKNNSVVRILVDGEEFIQVNTKNHSSGTGSFSANLSNISLGSHTITAVARDERGKESFFSDPLIITVLPATPAPILHRPVVNADSGIERPFITGLAKNSLEVFIVIDDKVVHRLPLGSEKPETVSFAWQPTQALSLGRHKVEAYASDGGKLSNNSVAQFWQVGEVAVDQTVVPKDDADVMEKEDEPIGAGATGQDKSSLSVGEPEDTTPLTVKGDLAEEEPEEPVVPEVIEPEIPDEPQGTVVADDELIAGVTTGPGTGDEDEAEVTELAPGAVVRDDASIGADDAQEFTFNTSLIIGIVILIFLLLSIFVWYIQEKRAQLGEKVVNIFKEESDDASGIPPIPGEPTPPSEPRSDFDSPFSDSGSGYSDAGRLPGDLHTDSIRPPESPSTEFEPTPPDTIDIPSVPEPFSSDPSSSEEDKRRKRDDDTPADDLPPPPPPMF